MAIRIDGEPGADFGEPIRLLSDCHRRIERFLDSMLGVAEAAAGGALTEPQRVALDTALRYFDGAAPLHSADEEQSLFPRMRATGHPAMEAAGRILDSLEADHRTADTAHAEAASLAREWLERGSLTPEATRRLTALLRDLRRLYDFHIALEDDDVFPLAAEKLSADAILETGREMMLRRGLDPDKPSPAGRCVRRREARDGL
jgi:hemerythrin-like domain-containing protein